MQVMAFAAEASPVAENGMTTKTIDPAAPST
jgi:hypothetical protein